jgi:hypothetical protein
MSFKNAFSFTTTFNASDSNIAPPMYKMYFIDTPKYTTKSRYLPTKNSLIKNNSVMLKKS